MVSSTSTLPHTSHKPPCCPRCTQHTQGFTLIEIAIVLIIIALLTGGVIKGLELVENSRLQKTSEQLQALGIAWFNYIQRYAQLPGDDSVATDRFGTDAHNGDGNSVLDTTEQPYVWEHLHYANMVVGQGQQATLSPWGNPYSYLYHNTSAKHYVCLSGVDGERAQTLDTQLDNGLPHTGNLRILDTADTVYSMTNSYTLCYSL